MGISGLLPALKSIAKEQHVGAYRGKRVAVDGFSWLHKGAYCCARELCEGVYTDKFVRYCMSRVDMLLHNGVEPVIVFDGGRLPMKAEEEDTRRRSRTENKAKALAHLAAGNVAAAQECFQRAVSITSTMAKQFIEALKERNVAYLVAPYEADAQMAYLALQGHVHAIITEDSDLLVYGCPRVLYKLDKQGQGEEILLENLVLNQGISFVGFTHAMFVMTCIMAGCDFLPSLPNIGMKKAHQQIKKHRSFVKAVKSLRFSGTAVPKEYEQRFQQTIWVFKHQRVYCPTARELVHVQLLPAGGLGSENVDVMSALPPADDPCGMDFLGPLLDATVAQGIALGDIDPNTKTPYNLADIYSGCQYLPRGVARAMGVNPQRGSGAASCRSDFPSSRGASGWSQRSASQPGDPSDAPTQSQAYSALQSSGAGSHGSVPHLLTLGATGQPVLPGLRRPASSAASLSKKTVSSQAPAGGGIRRFLHFGSSLGKAAGGGGGGAGGASLTKRSLENQEPPVQCTLPQQGTSAISQVQPTSASKRKFAGGPPATAAPQAKAALVTQKALLSWLGNNNSFARDPQAAPILKPTGIKGQATATADIALSDITNAHPRSQPGLGVTGNPDAFLVPDSQGTGPGLDPASGQVSEIDFDRQYPVSPTSDFQQQPAKAARLSDGERPWPQHPSAPPAAVAEQMELLLCGAGSSDGTYLRDALHAPGGTRTQGLLDSCDGGIDLLNVGTSPEGGQRRREAARHASAMTAGSSGLASQDWRSELYETGPGLQASSMLDLHIQAKPSRDHSPARVHRAVSINLVDSPASGSMQPRSGSKLQLSTSLQEQDSPVAAASLALIDTAVHVRKASAAQHPAEQHRQRRSSTDTKICEFFKRQDAAGQPDPNQATAEPGRRHSSAAELLQRTVQRMQGSLAPLVMQADARDMPDLPAEDDGPSIGRRPPGLAAAQAFSKFAAPAGKFGLRPRRTSGFQQQPAEQIADGVGDAADADDSSGQRDQEHAGDMVMTTGAQAQHSAQPANFHDLGHVAHFQAVAAKALQQVESDLMQRFAFNGSDQHEQPAGRAGSHGKPGLQPKPRRGGAAGLCRSGPTEAAKKPFKPPRLSKDGSPAPAGDMMGIKRFAFVVR